MKYIVGTLIILSIVGMVVISFWFTFVLFISLIIFFYRKFGNSDDLGTLLAFLTTIVMISFSIIIGSFVDQKQHTEINDLKIKLIENEKLILEDFTILDDKGLYYKCLLKECDTITKEKIIYSVHPYINDIFTRASKTNYYIKD